MKSIRLAGLIAGVCVFVCSGAFAGGPPAAKKKAPVKHWGHVDTAPAYAIAGGKAIARLVHEGKAYIGMLEGLPGLVVPEHIHKDAVELLWVLQGGGIMTIAGKEAVVRPGMAIQVPAGVKHSFRIPANAKTRFVAVQVYTRSGPQKRFTLGRKLAPAPKKAK